MKPRNFNDFFNHFWERLRVKVLRKSTKIAEYTSVYPAPMDLLLRFPPAAGALDCLAQYLTLCILFPQLSRNQYSAFCVAEQLAERAYRHGYQGHWATVQQLIEQPPFLYNQLELLRANFSEDDIFGNLVPRVLRFIEAARPVSRSSLARKRDRRKVRRKERRRGYTDHGTLRPVDSRARFEANRRSEKEEKRDLRLRVFKPRNSNFWIGKDLFSRCSRGVLQTTLVSLENMPFKERASFFD